MVPGTAYIAVANALKPRKIRGLAFSVRMSAQGFRAKAYESY